tara:strand:- start:3892 stop:4239 length:348 start_codon:yes stop_codon:yes gene_type:complete
MILFRRSIPVILFALCKASLANMNADDIQDGVPLVEGLLVVPFAPAHTEIINSLNTQLMSMNKQLLEQNFTLTELINTRNVMINTRNAQLLEATATLIDLRHELYADGTWGPMQQ